MPDEPQTSPARRTEQGHDETMPQHSPTHHIEHEHDVMPQPSPTEQGPSPTEQGPKQGLPFEKDDEGTPQS